jgi:hypothetical protein
MTTIKITIRKELDVDLNAYFPQFPRSLKTLIEGAILDLAGGQPRKHPPKTTSAANGHPPEWKKGGDGQLLSHDNRTLRLSGKPPQRGKILVSYRDIERVWGKESFLMGDLKKHLASEGIEKKYVSTVVANMYARGCFEVDRLD